MTLWKVTELQWCTEKWTNFTQRNEADPPTCYYLYTSLQTITSQSTKSSKLFMFFHNLHNDKHQMCYRVL